MKNTDYLKENPRIQIVNSMDDFLTFSIDSNEETNAVVFPRTLQGDFVNAAQYLLDRTRGHQHNYFYGFSLNDTKQIQLLSAPRAQKPAFKTIQTDIEQIEAHSEKTIKIDVEGANSRKHEGAQEPFICSGGSAQLSDMIFCTYAGDPYVIHNNDGVYIDEDTDTGISTRFNTQTTQLQCGDLLRIKRHNVNNDHHLIEENPCVLSFPLESPSLMEWVKGKRTKNQLQLSML